jgi:hypothetical protein
MSALANEQIQKWRMWMIQPGNGKSELLEPPAASFLFKQNR